MIEILLPAIIAVGTIGLILGIVLGIASRLFGEKADQKVEQVKALLPNMRCGACGFASCEALAESMVRGTSPYDACFAGGSETAGSIARLLGGENTVRKRKVARVLCSGTVKHTVKTHHYQGIQTCQAAQRQFRGEWACKHGCLGMGDCVRACPFGAICVQNGIAIIREAKCRGCEKCIPACPRGIIRMVPEDSRVTVACHSRETAKDTIRACKRGCIGCGKCAKACPRDAITVENSLAVIHPGLCDQCGKCIEVCPVRVIFRYES